MPSHHFWIWSRVSTSRFREDKCLVNCDACGVFQVILGVDISWDWRLVVQNMKNCFCGMADIFMSRKSIFFMWLDLISSSFISILVSSSNSVASILQSNLLLKLIFSKLLFKLCYNCRNVLILVNEFWWEHFVVSFITLVSYEISSVSDFRLTSSLCCFSLNWFGYYCWFSCTSFFSSNLWSDLLDISSDL